MDIQNLRTFVCVANMENYSKSAEEMNYSQSTVTAQIKALEKELGFPLFERIGRKNYLTENGKEFLVYASEILHTFQKAEGIGKDFKNMKGCLRIGVLESLLFANLLPVINDVQSQFPNVEINIKMGQTYELISMLKQNQLDIIYISTANNSDSSLKCLYSTREELIFVASSMHPFSKHNKDLTANDVFSYPFIITEPSGYCYGRLKEIASEYNQSLKHHITVDSVTAIVQLLSDNKSIAFLPKYALKDSLNSNIITKLNTKISNQYYYSQLLCTKDKWLSPFLESFVSLIKNKYPETK